MFHSLIKRSKRGFTPYINFALRLRRKYEAPRSCITGFTLVELIVFLALLMIMLAMLISNFTKYESGKETLYQTAQNLVSELNIAQINASSARYHNAIPYCGWGIRYNATQLYTYDVYVGETRGASHCGTVTNRNWDAPQAPPCAPWCAGEPIVSKNKLINSDVIQFRSGFTDIFFEGPNGKVYVNNVLLGPTAAGGIVLQVVGTTTCTSSTCVLICIYGHNRIDIQDGTSTCVVNPTTTPDPTIHPTVTAPPTPTPTATPRV